MELMERTVLMNASTASEACATLQQETVSVILVSMELIVMKVVQLDNMGSTVPRPAPVTTTTATLSLVLAPSSQTRGWV